MLFLGKQEVYRMKKLYDRKTTLVFSTQKTVQLSNWSIDSFSELTISVVTFCELTTFLGVLKSKPYYRKQKLVQYVPNKDKVAENEIIRRNGGGIDTLASAHNGGLPWIGGIATEKNIECFSEETCIHQFKNF